MNRIEGLEAQVVALKAENARLREKAGEPPLVELEPDASFQLDGEDRTSQASGSAPPKPTKAPTRPAAKRTAAQAKAKRADAANGSGDADAEATKRAAGKRKMSSKKFSDDVDEEDEEEDGMFRGDDNDDYRPAPEIKPLPGRAGRKSLLYYPMLS